MSNQINNNVDKNLENLYENLILEYQTGFNPPNKIPNQVSPKEAGTKLSYNKQTIGMAPPMVTANVYGEQEEEPVGILKIIQEIEQEYVGDSPTNNAVRLAFGKLKERLNHD